MITTAIPLGEQTDAVIVSITRPTTGGSVAWTAGSRIQVRLVITLDGTRYEWTGRASGGRRVVRGVERPAYVLVCRPTWGYFGTRDGVTKRLGETGINYTVSLELSRLSGSVDSVVQLDATDAPAPAAPFHNSVAFDTATDVREETGDGVVSLTHTAGGSDRGVFAGVVSANSAGLASTGVTYAGNAMAEMWDVVANTNYGNAGYRLAGAGVATGAQTVTSTLAGAPDGEHILGVITMTGVDGTTPVGTPQTASGTTSPATVTVTGVGADDLVVDNLTLVGDNPTIGADQTERYTEIGGVYGLRQRGSTQPGTAGGVMSWTFIDDAWTLGAVAFKPTGAAPAAGRASNLGLLGVS